VRVPCCRGCSVRSVSVIRIRLGANVGMSEAKRVPLQTLEFPESLGHATKKEKKGNMGKQLAPSFRFTLTLPESNEKTCPEFNYSQLLKSAEVGLPWRRRFSMSRRIRREGMTVCQAYDTRNIRIARERDRARARARARERERGGGREKERTRVSVGGTRRE